ncbi:hypothetical protein PsorP6_006182 [Peronosclerospora sorghi]|uniref:Uncharacterized protein n=1 Tax=Peronosclerospora sorghi TaxID=230839 RepID=A0ACC0W2V3_9STRA|nr:hypothetical protein PsorP6_006182 [Peronosclerospora sorghi]
MIDMGFEPQVVAVLENMGSMLKSENEDEMEKQLTLANGANVVTELHHRFHVTTMFSATMPVEVERLATTFLRHPSIVKIGDDDSGKNKLIDQRVLFMNPGKKRLKLVEILREILSAHSVPVPRSRKEKVVDGAEIIVFVIIKKELTPWPSFSRVKGFDERNYYCWNYRRQGCNLAGVSREDHFAFKTQKIEQNFSNYSALHHRSITLPDPLTVDVLLDEIALVQQAVFTDPDDQSAWFYYHWLVTSMLTLLQCSAPDAATLLTSQVQ